jgi:hypothetical protein
MPTAAASPSPTLLFGPNGTGAPDGIGVGFLMASTL